MRASRWSAVVVVAGLGLAGCAAHDDPLPAATRSVGGGTAPWTSCRQELGSRWPVAVTTDTLTLTPLAHAFDPTSVVVCDEQTETRADGGQELVATEARGTEVAALEAALALPDRPATSGACTADLETVPWFAVLDRRGRWVRPGLPFDECHKPRVEVTDALRAMPLTTLSTVPIRLLESGAAVQAGCEMQWADTVDAETGSGGETRPAATRADPFADVGRVRVCVYRVPPTELGADKPAGAFLSGGLLSAASRRDLGTLLTGLPAATPCTQEATRFAVITRVKVGQLPTAYLELDGCRRLLVQTWLEPGVYTEQLSTLSQASGDLVAFIERVRPTA